MKRLARWLAGAFLMVVLAALLVAWRAWSVLEAPAGGAAVVTVPPGATLRPILDELHRRGVLEHPTLLYAYARATGQTAIKTGEYDIGAEHSPRQILAMLRQGRVALVPITLAEGLNRWQVRDLLARQGWMEAATFDRLCDDADFLARHEIPGPTCEGYVFPETYRFARGVSPETLFAETFATYRRALAEATASGRGPLDLGERELVTLASIVEKETGDPSERPRIACLFYNRLQAKPPWRLQTDPTVIYAATLADPRFDGNLKRYHLREMDHPYNTYLRPGLPPGPIANPGRAALHAVVQPATCSDFFFVSMNNGRHVFCPDLPCHEAAVQKWQVEYFRRRR